MTVSKIEIRWKQSSIHCFSVEIEIMHETFCVNKRRRDLILLYEETVHEMTCQNIQFMRNWLRLVFDVKTSL